MATLTGLALIVLLVPANALLSRAIAYVSKTIMLRKDERLGALHDLFKNIRSVKLLNLENR